MCKNYEMTSGCCEFLQWRDYMYEHSKLLGWLKDNNVGRVLKWGAI